MARYRIRKMRVPASRRPDVTYPTLMIQVVGKSGEAFVVPTLAEGLVHLLSADGFSLIVDDLARSRWWRRGEGIGRPTTTDGSASITIRRDGERLVITNASGGPINSYEYQNGTLVSQLDSEFTDYDVDAKITPSGKLTVKVVDIVI